MLDKKKQKNTHGKTLDKIHTAFITMINNMKALFVLVGLFNDITMYEYCDK